MAATYDSRTIGVRINRSPRDVYDFASNPENLPKWAAGLGTSGEWVGETWHITTPHGPVTVRFTERNDYGILDHYVGLGRDAEIYNPMRVVANGSGSEVSFTVFRRPDMSDATFAADAEAVERDLQTLKALLEA